MPGKKRAFNNSKTAKSGCDEEIKQLRQQYENISDEKGAIKRFADFPLSQKTLRGLADAKYEEPTDIQRESIGPALQGKNVLGAAITGSGKTLAFLIPLLEHLYVAKWSRTDGIAAIIISPTRELAYQIFETLKKIGKYHDFSAGLIIGGKNLKFERKRMDQCNILICTPGRLLQHMDENPLFNASTMEMFVLDEADRCLDMGFEKTLNAIIENFPPDRQTLLFSATLTSSVKDLARLNLHDPVYVGQQREQSAPKVPDLLQQNYVVVALEDKITMLWSFIKNHLKQKIIVFFSSCKQVKYMYEIFCKLRPGTSLLALYGTQHQDRRIAIYNDFVRKSNVVLFATDIASRGLDFPAINWVVQFDCPEDITQYIHRAGRSARNKARGESLLVLLPSEEESMVGELNKHFISVRKIQIDPSKLFSPRAKMEAFLAQNPELKASAQRAFVAYIKSVFLMRNKKIFNVLKLDFDAFAKSLGLVVTPRVRFLENFLKKHNVPGIGTRTEFVEEKEKIDSDFRVEDSDADDDFIKLKRIDHGLGSDDILTGAEDDPLPIMPKKEKLVTKAAIAKKAIKKRIQMNTKRKFNDEGEEIVDPLKQMQSSLAKEYEKQALDSGGIDIEVAKQLLSEEDKYDKKRFRELVKQRRRKLKKKLEKLEGRDENDMESGDDDGGSSVDLSWLPDPDKIYENKDNNTVMRHRKLDDSIAGSSDDESVASEEFEQPVKKKPKVTSKLSLNDAETIAAQLLTNTL